MTLFVKYLSLHLQKQMQYKLSFFFSFIAQFLSIYIDYLAIYSLFNKFSILKEYNIYEVMITFSISYISFSLVETLGRGFDLFERLINNGSFDLLLIRPRNIYLQIIGSEIAYQKAAKVINALIILIIAIINLKIEINIVNILILLLMIISSTFIFMGIMILGAAFCFVTIKGIEVVNIFTYGTRQVAQYPINIYGKHLLRFFTFVIPIACANYYPLSYLLHNSTNTLYLVYPLMGILFIIPSILIFNLGLKKYHSTGS
jgi:ABC-2 type transport system permease protein